MKKLIFDVYYHEDTGIAKTAAVEFNNFTDQEASKIWIDESKIASEYIPGQFYKRELPAIVSLIENQIGIDKFKAEYDTIIVDGLYQLEPNHKGLGAHVKEYFDSLNINIEVIGLSKTYFHNCESVAEKVIRGKNVTKELYVNGSLQKDYGNIVKEMAGDYRLPYMVKLVDKMCRM